MNKYNRHATHSIEHIVALILANRQEPEKVTKVAVSDLHSTHVTSKRLRTFARAAQAGRLYCAECGCKASFFSVDTFAHNKADFNPHLNLYGYNDAGEEVLFTHDHIVARALGGADNLSNTQVMCSPCNNRKGQFERLIAESLQKQKKSKQMASTA